MLDSFYPAVIMAPKWGGEGLRFPPVHLDSTSILKGEKRVRDELK